MRLQSCLGQDLTLGLIQPKPVWHANRNIFPLQSKHKKQISYKASKTDQLHTPLRCQILPSLSHVYKRKYLSHFSHYPAVRVQSLFIFRDGSPLTRYSCLKHRRRFLHKTGYSPGDFNTHSFRIGTAMGTCRTVDYLGGGGGLPWVASCWTVLQTCHVVVGQHSPGTKLQSDGTVILCPTIQSKCI